MEVLHGLRGDPWAGLGGAIGQGLGQGLEQLAAHKMQEVMQQRQQKQTMQGLQGLGYNHQEAQQLSSLPPEIMREVVKRKLQQPNEQAYMQALSGIIGGQQNGNSANIPGGITADQATKLADLQLKKQENESKREERKYAQQKEDAIKVKPYVDKIDGELNNVRNNISDLNKLKQLIEKNKDKLPGSWVKSVPEFVSNYIYSLNPELEEINRLTKSIPISMNEIARGNPSLGRLKSLEKSKVQLGESYKSIIPGIKTIEERVKNAERSLISRKSKLLENTGLSMDEDTLSSGESNSVPTQYMGSPTIIGDNGQVYAWDQQQNKYRPLAPKG